MLGFGKTLSARAPVTAVAPGDRDAAVYDRHAVSLYRQALLTLDDAGLAAQVVCDVLVNECVWSPTAAGDARCRLAVAAYWRCQQLADRHAGRDQPAGHRPAESSADVDQYGLSSRERGALGLVLFGGLGYAQTSRELAIPPSDMAALLRAALHGLATATAGLTYPACPRQ